MFWIVSLALSTLLALQLYIAASDEITVPGAVIHELEKHLADRGLRCTFGAIHCDTAGRIRINDLALYTATHADPIATARAVRFEVNPYALMAHKVLPRGGRVEGLSLRVPAMFSGSGENTPVIDNLDAEVELRSPQLLVNSLTARAGNLAIICRGAITLPKAADDAHPHASLLADAMRAYLETARQISALLPELNALERPLLDITLAPAGKRIATARVAFIADSLHVGSAADSAARSPDAPRANAGTQPQPQPRRAAFGPLSADTSVGIDAFLPAQTKTAEPIRIQFSTTDALLPAGVRARNARLAVALPLPRLLQSLRAAAAASSSSSAAPEPLPIELNLTLDSLTARDIAAHGLNARVTGEYPQNLHASVTASVLGETLSLETVADASDKTAAVHITTAAGTRHIAAIARELRVPALPTILQPARPAGIEVEARLASGWKFERAAGTLDIGPILAQRVHIDRARGSFVYDHAARTITFSPALAVTGDSIARGSYEMNFSTLGFRFLLTGQLRPLDIRGWFGPWWPNFWDDFEFGGPLPHGDVDVQGFWKNPRLATVFVAGEGRRLTYKTVSLDHVHTTLFIRPDYFDALELIATRGPGNVRGSFTHHLLDPGNRHVETRLAFHAENIDPAAVAPAIHPQVAAMVAPLKFQTPPALLDISGTFTGPASPAGRHASLDIEAQGAGPFAYDGIPLVNLSTRIAVRDDIISLERLSTQFAGGHLDLKVKVSGTGNDRRLGFDADVRSASLGNALHILGAHAARKRGEPAEPKSKYQQQLANARIDTRISADGLYGDPLSFTGNGSTEISGTELININLLGTLSHALRSVPGLNFTSLNFNAAQSNFIINNHDIEITEANITGPRAKVNIKGRYRLDAHTASLTAKVYPLSETRNFIGATVGFLLTPVSGMLELKLDGPLDAPKWRFSYGPTSLFRALSGKSSAESKPAQTQHAGQQTQAAQQAQPDAGQPAEPEK